MSEPSYGDRSLSTHSRDKKCIQTLVGNLKVSSHLEDISIDVRIILESILEK